MAFIKKKLEREKYESRSLRPRQRHTTITPPYSEVSLTGIIQPPASTN